MTDGSSLLDQYTRNKVNEVLELWKMQEYNPKLSLCLFLKGKN